MLYFPKKYEKKYPNINQSILDLKGELTDKQAMAALGKFLRANLGFGLELLTKRKVTLATYQEILLKALFNRNFSMIVASRGASKSFIAAIIAFLYPLFNPGTNVVICGPTFRTARHIFNNLEKIIDSKEGFLLKECFGAKSKRNDAFEIALNGGIIRAIPMNSDKLRGFRAQLLILDEYLLFSEEVVKKVLMPFLLVPSNVGERIRQADEEDELVKEGKIEEKDRMVFPSSARMICLTSASYTFEPCYKTFQEWIENILAEDKVVDATYFVAQIGYKALPKLFIEKSVIEEASSMGEHDPIFQREFGAHFTDGSDSYFSAKKMHELTVKDSDSPCMEIRGKSEDIYVLGCDPSFSNSPSSDFFAMCVLKLNPENETATVVHSYMEAGKDLKEHIKYFYYLLKAFNIQMICFDNADGGFTSSCNESALFQDNKFKVNLLEYNGELHGDDYNRMLLDFKKEYNLSNNKICFKHVFNQQSIRRINEQLQTWINTKKIWFASRLTSHNDYESAITSGIPYPFEESENKNKFIVDLISNEDDLVYQIKKQASLIEIRNSPSGGQIFDLPVTLKRNKSANRARKDGYTSLLLAIEAAKAYFDMNRAGDVKKSANLWMPIMMGKTTY
jgi:hypothetical protein